MLEGRSESSASCGLGDVISYDGDFYSVRDRPHLHPSGHAAAGLRPSAFGPKALEVALPHRRRLHHRQPDADGGDLPAARAPPPDRRASRGLEWPPREEAIDAAYGLWPSGVPGEAEPGAAHARHF